MMQNTNSGYSRPSGQTTAYFRSLWKLNSVLNDGPSSDGGRVAKSRADHRHHAVDAVVIGLTDAGMVKRLSDAAQRAPIAGRKRFAALEGPWPNFVDTSAPKSTALLCHTACQKRCPDLCTKRPYIPSSMPRPRRTARCVSRDSTNGLTNFRRRT